MQEKPIGWINAGMKSAVWLIVNVVVMMIFQIAGNPVTVSLPVMKNAVEMINVEEDAPLIVHPCKWSAIRRLAGASKSVYRIATTGNVAMMDAVVAVEPAVARLSTALKVGTALMIV